MRWEEQAPPLPTINLEQQSNIVGAGVPDCPCKTQRNFINGAKNIILLLNQGYYGLLIHRKRSPFPHKGRLFVTLR